MAGDSKAVTRTMEIAMTDAMRFSPDRLSVRQGETVRLVIRNNGKMLHELVIGTKAGAGRTCCADGQVPEHGARRAVHGPRQTRARPGKIVWHFNRAGEFDFACLIAGHYQAGMVGKITVTPAEPQGEHHETTHPLAAVLAAGTPYPCRRQTAQPLVEVWKDPNCGCCKDWIKHLEANGFP
jgi:uncharacterized cupredoxin-like copper-binding protein